MTIDLTSFPQRKLDIIFVRWQNSAYMCPYILLRKQSLRGISFGLAIFNGTQRYSMPMIYPPTSPGSLLEAAHSRLMKIINGIERVYLVGRMKDQSHVVENTFCCNSHHFGSSNYKPQTLATFLIVSPPS